jgi:hypothetical protein
MGWWSTLLPVLFKPEERPSIPSAGDWAGLGPILVYTGDLDPTAIRSPDRPALRKSL